MFAQAPNKLKNAYKSKLSPEDPDSIAILAHLMDWSGLTTYASAADHETLIRVNERQRFVHSIFHNILDLNDEDIRTKILQRIESKLEDNYNVE
jgi:hypothetical protein